MLELDSGHAEARRVLAEILAGAGQWAALWPHLEDKCSACRAIATRRRRGATTPTSRPRAARRRSASPRARSSLFDLALEIDPHRVPVLLARADALVQDQAWDAAATAYNAILVRHSAALERGQRIEVHRRQAQIQSQLGHPTQVLALYQKVLEIDPRHRETLQELAELHVDRKRFDEALACLGTLVDAVPVDERAAIHERIADLHREKLGNPERAASIYPQALDVDGGNHRILQKLLDLQTQTRTWRPALATIARFVELEKEPARRGRYYLAAAIARHETGEPALALEQYDDALEALLPPGGRVDATSRARALEALRGIESLLTAAGDWPRLERTYRLLIDRLPPGRPGRGGAVAQPRRDLPVAPRAADRAIEAFERAQPSIRPSRLTASRSSRGRDGQGSAEPMADMPRCCSRPTRPAPARTACSPRRTSRRRASRRGVVRVSRPGVPQAGDARRGGAVPQPCRARAAQGQGRGRRRGVGAAARSRRGPGDRATSGRPGKGRCRCAWGRPELRAGGRTSGSRSPAARA